VRVRSETSNRTKGCDCAPATVRRPVGGIAKRLAARQIMVRLDTDTSNQFWQELEEWENQLKAQSTHLKL